MMSFFKSLLGGSSAKPPSPSPKSGLEQLREKEEMVTKKIAHIEKQIEECEQTIKENINKNKRKALESLKSKKRYEEQLKQNQGILTNIENQIEMLENASTNAAIMQTMAQTAKIMKQAHNNMDINQVEDTLDEIKEQQEIAKEISNMIATPGIQQHDEDELLKELEGMQQQELDEKLLQTDSHPTSLPEVPSAEPIATSSHKSAASKKAEEELEKLKAWAAQ